MDTMNSNTMKVGANPGAPHAVEVVSMLGDSVVAVQHLEPNRQAPSTKSSWMLIAAGGILLIVAAIAFAKGVAVAAANKQALLHWVDVLGLPEYEFRPTELGLGYDIMTFGGFFGGIAAIALGMFRLRATQPKSTFTVGTASESDFATELAPVAQFALVRDEADGVVVSVAPGMSGEVRHAGGVDSVADLAARGLAAPSATVAGAYDVAVPRDASVKVTAGPTRFVIRTVPATTSRLASLFSGSDHRALTFFGGSALAHAALLLLLNLVPPQPSSLELTAGTSGTRMTHVESKVPEDPAETRPDEPTDDPTGDEGEDEAFAVNGDKGTMGTFDADNEGGETKIEKRTENPTLARSEALRLARDQGINQVLRSSDVLRDIASFAHFDSGSDDMTQYGGGRRDGDGTGTFGAAKSGDGPGNGNDNIIELPKNWYKRVPRGKTGDKITLKGHTKKRIVVKIKDPVIDGGLDKSTIRRYIKKKLSLISYYYERELLANHSLEGTVTVTFVIDGNGAVLAANGMGIGNKRLESAIADVIASIDFPRTTDGGSVRVVYPFNFHRTGT